jgi:2-keto-4-pentenoate hydratase/2-oxohepta-3-ene-1,7-dioic acid hydratase in catechol pathway
MKLVTFTHNNVTRVGAVVEEFVVDSKGSKKIPSTMIDFLKGGTNSFEEIKTLIDSRRAQIALSDIKLNAPILNPQKYLGLSLNYADHIAETGRDQPQYPSFFSKQSSCIIGYGDVIHKPKVSDKLDYEGELAFVIGKRCRHVPVEQAHQVIAGYTISNDVSVRDWQMHSPTMMIGKSFDTCGPLGPWIVTPDEIGNPHNLGINPYLTCVINFH